MGTYRPVSLTPAEHRAEQVLNCKRLEMNGTALNSILCLAKAGRSNICILRQLIFQTRARENNLMEHMESIYEIGNAEGQQRSCERNKEAAKSKAAITGCPERSSDCSYKYCRL